MTAPHTTAPVEPKVTAATVAAAVTALVLGFVGRYVEVPAELGIPLGTLILAACTFGAGYAKRTATTLLRERLIAQAPPALTRDV